MPKQNQQLGDWNNFAHTGIMPRKHGAGNKARVAVTATEALSRTPVMV